MKNVPDPAARALIALEQVRELLQRAHFAARSFEAEMPAGRHLSAELLTDGIHRVRQSAEQLALELERRAARS